MEKGKKSLINVFKRKLSCDIIVALYPDNIMRFSELEKLLKINPRNLAENLFFLLGSGVLLRSLTMDVPAQTEYSLTQSGREAAEIIKAMITWADKPIPKEEELATFI